MVALAEKFDEVLAQLPPEKLRETQARIAFLLDPSGSGVGSADQQEAKDNDLELVGKEFFAVLQSHGDRRPMPLGILLKTKTGRFFRKGSKQLLQYIREEFEPKKRVEEVFAIKVLLRLMAKDIAQFGRQVCPTTLAQRMERVSQVVDRHFPGYRESGLLKSILTPGRTPSTED